MLIIRWRPCCFHRGAWLALSLLVHSLAGAFIPSVVLFESLHPVASFSLRSFGVDVVTNKALLKHMRLGMTYHADGRVNEALGGDRELDPFRPGVASTSPVIINALVPLLFAEGTDLNDVAAAALERRRGDSTFSEAEETNITERIRGVLENLAELRFMLATAVGRVPSIARYGMLMDYGMSDNVEDDPLAAMNQAECLLALYILYREKKPTEAIDFLDDDRLKVLSGKSA